MREVDLFLSRLSWLFVFKSFFAFVISCSQAAASSEELDNSWSTKEVASIISKSSKSSGSEWFFSSCSSPG